METNGTAGPLAHVRVLDLSRILAGPWAGQLLGDYGADVIKVERPGVGDDTRSWGPPYARDAEGRDTRDAAYFLCANRNKRSVTVDFTKPDGQRIVQALAHRERTGQGQHIDLALLDVQVASLANQTMNYLVSGVAPVRMGNAHPNIVPYQDFPTRDGDMIVAVGNDAQFARLCAAAGHPEWAGDARFANNPARVANREAFVAAFSAVSRTRTTAEWVAALEAAGVPCGPINTIAEVFADPQVQARGMQRAMRHGAGGEVQLVANPVRLSETPPSYRLPPPLLGAHTREVLTERLGMGGEEIEALARAGIV